MRIIYRIIFIIAATIFTAGCTRTSDSEVDRAMEIAENVMEEHPDSALTILEAIPTENLNGERRHALHALLMTQARDKNYIDQTSDTLISRAVAYFDTSDDAYHRMLAHYYLSKIYYYGKMYNSATYEAETAKDLLRLITSPQSAYWEARLCLDIAKIAYNTSNYQYCVNNLEQSIYLFDSLKLDSWKTDANLMLARSYQLTENWEKADSLLSTIQNQCTTEYHKSEYLQALSHSLANKGEWGEASKTYAKLLTCTVDSIESYDYAYLAYLEAQNQNIEASNNYINKAFSIAKTSNDTLSTLHYLLRKHIAEIHDTTLMHMLERYRTLNLNEAQNRINNHTAIGSRRYISAKLEIEKKSYELLRSKQKNYILGFITIITTLICILFILKNYTTNRINQLAFLNSRLHTDIEKLNRITESSNEEKRDIVSSLSQTLSHGITQINNISKKKLLIDRELEVIKSTTAKPSKSQQIEMSFLNDFTKTMSKLNSPEAYLLLEDALNKSQENIISKFRSDFPDFPEKDIQLAILIFAKMTTHTITLILGLHNINTTRMRKFRLKRTIEESTAEYKEIYLQYFS